MTEPIVTEPQNPVEFTPLVPVEKTRRVIIKDDARKIEKAANVMRAAGIVFLSACLKCLEAKRNAMLTTHKDEQTGEIVLSCDCSEWVLTRQF